MANEERHPITGEPLESYWSRMHAFAATRRSESADQPPTPEQPYTATVDVSSGFPVVTITRTSDGKQQSIQLDDEAFI